MTNQRIEKLHRIRTEEKRLVRRRQVGWILRFPAIGRGGDGGNGLPKWSQSRPYYNDIFISRKPRSVSGRLHLPTLMCLCVVFLLATPSFSQQAYRWTDDKGTVHFTDDPSKIPDRYRDQVISIEAPQPPTPKAAPPSKSAPSVEPKESPDRVKQYLEDYDRKVEEMKNLEKRASTLEEELKKCEARLKEIDQLEKEDLSTQTMYRIQAGSRFPAIVTRYSEEKANLQNRVQEIKPELEDLQEEISSLRRSL